MGATREVLLVHAVGGGDLGCPGVRCFDGVTPDLEGDPDAIGTARRPLRKIFDALLSTEIHVSRIALLGTTTPGAPGNRTFAEWADDMRERLTSASGLCGGRFAGDMVDVVRVEAVGLEHTSRALGPLLSRRAPAEILIGCGSGAFALSAGAFCAALASRRPARILGIDSPHEPYAVNQGWNPDDHLVSWLLRHRFWDALAEADPGAEAVWRLLAARQAGDVRRAGEVRRSGESVEGLKPGQLEKLTELWPTAQAAFFERVGRGEAADYGLMRAWFTHQLSNLFNREEQDLPPRVQKEISQLIRDLRTRQDHAGGLSSRLRVAARALRSTTDSACISMIKDPALVQLYTDASTHRAHLAPETLEPEALPPTVIAAADEWEKSDQTVKLVASAAPGRVCWPVLGSGDVLGMLAVGLGREGRDAEDRQVVRAVLNELRRRRERLLRRGAVRLRLLASPETADRAHWLARSVENETADVDVRVIEDVRGGIGRIRDVVISALQAEAPPTGRTVRPDRLTSGSPRDVDEIVLVLNPGPSITNYGMIATAAEWSLIAACSLWVTELSRTPEAPAGEILGGHRILARLGADQALAQLAVSAVKRLDLRTARRLVRRGSEELCTVDSLLGDLEKGVFGSVSDGWTWDKRLIAARQRLTLIAEVGRGMPWMPVAYLAVQALRPAVFTWHKWGDLCKMKPTLDELGKRATLSVQGHALDRRAQALSDQGAHGGNHRGQRGGSHPRNRQTANGSQPVDDTLDLLRRVIAEFDISGEMDNRLIKQHKSVINSLEVIYRQGA